MIQLYINDQLCDITGVEKIVMTYVRNDLGDISTRNGDYSNSFSLPKTNVNKTIFKSINVLNSNSDSTRIVLQYKIVVSGIVVSIGVAQLKSVGETFNVFLKSNNTDLYEKIQGLSIKDLNLRPYQHVWNIANTVAANTNTDGYIYPIIDSAIGATAMDNTVRQFDVYTHVPAMFYHTLVRLIIEEAGFSLIGDFINNTRYKSLVVPCISAKINPENPPYGVDVYSDTGTLYSAAPAAVNFYKSVVFDKENFDNFNLFGINSFSIFGQPASSNYSYNAQDNNLNTTVEIDFSTNITGSAVITIGVYEYRAGSFATPYQTFIYEQTEDTGVFSINSSVVNKKIKIQALSATLSANDKIYVAVQVTNNGADVSEITINRATLVAFPESSKYIYPLQPFDIAYNLPNISQVDFLKNIFNQFCILINTDNSTNEIEFKQFGTIARDKPNALDWSDKIDDSREEEIYFSIGDYAKTNYLKYTDDDTIPIDSINSSFVIENENLKEEKIVYTSPFCGAVMSKKLIGLDVPTALLFDVTSPILELKPKIFTLDTANITGGGLLYTNDGSGPSITTSTSIPLCHFSYFAKDFNLDWDSLLGDYYIELIELLSNPKILTLNIRLKSIDIAQLDMFRLVWIERYNSHFYINKISQYDFTSNDSTEVELIKLP